MYSAQLDKGGKNLFAGLPAINCIDNYAYKNKRGSSGFRGTGI